MPASVDLVQPTLAVMPGETVSTTIRVTNTGRIVDELSFDVLGDAGGYTTIEPARVPLFPGAHGETTITFRPPRGHVAGRRQRPVRDPRPLAGGPGVLVRGRGQPSDRRAHGRGRAPRAPDVDRLADSGRARATASRSRTTATPRHASDSRLPTPTSGSPSRSRSRSSRSRPAAARSRRSREGPESDDDRRTGDAAVPGVGRPRWGGPDHARRHDRPAPDTRRRHQPDPDARRRRRASWASSPPRPCRCSYPRRDASPRRRASRGPRPPRPRCRPADRPRRRRRRRRISPRHPPPGPPRSTTAASSPSRAGTEPPETESPSATHHPALVAPRPSRSGSSISAWRPAGHHPRDADPERPNHPGPEQLDRRAGLFPSFPPASGGPANGVGSQRGPGA